MKLKTKSILGGRVEVCGPTEYVDAAASHIETTISGKAAAVRPLKPELENEPSTTACEPCPNCGRKWFDDQLRTIRDIFQRVATGEPMPAGECPECGALCHLAEGDSDSMRAALSRLSLAVEGLDPLRDDDTRAEVYAAELAELSTAQEQARAVLAGGSPALRVLIEVTGGVAEVTTCPPGVKVEIVDHDNERVGE